MRPRGFAGASLPLKSKDTLVKFGRVIKRLLFPAAGLAAWNDRVACLYCPRGGRGGPLIMSAWRRVVSNIVSTA